MERHELQYITKRRIATLSRPINRHFPIETSPYLMDEDV